MVRKHHFYLSGHHLSASSFHHNFMLFLEPLLDFTFLHCILICCENSDLVTPLQKPMGLKWHANLPNGAQNEQRKFPVDYHVGDLLPRYQLERSWVFVLLDLGWIVDEVWWILASLLSLGMDFVSKLRPSDPRPQVRRIWKTTFAFKYNKRFPIAFEIWWVCFWRLVCAL